MRDAIDKLRNILLSNIGGGTIDIVWGPELKKDSLQTYKYKGSTLVCGPRQSGRTTYLAKYIAKKVKEDGGGRITVTSPSFRRTKNLLQIVKSILGDECDTKYSVDSLVLSFNGWKIDSFTHDPFRMCGHRPDLLVVDDLDECNIEFVESLAFCSHDLLFSTLNFGPSYVWYSQNGEIEELNG
jgi:hypothetical protein